METKYFGGVGTKEAPYKIKSAHDWKLLSNTCDDWDKQFILIDDIDFDGALLTPIGNEYMPFVGGFNGDGHVAQNAIFDFPNSNHIGLFGYLSDGGTVRNLGVKHKALTGYNYVGGLVGSAIGAIIASCYSIGDATGHWGVGGLVGISDDGTVVTTCYTMGSIVGKIGVGGLAGWNRDNINTCYTSAFIKGEEYVGGITGHGRGNVESSYFNEDILSHICSNGGKCCSTKQMTYPHSEKVYFNWNFESDWAEDINYDVNFGYPFLRIFKSRQAS